MSSRRNAFAYFVEEYEAQVIALGRSIKKKQVLRECSSGWTDLDPDTRLRYCNMANPMLDEEGKPKAKTPPNMEWLDPVTGEYGEKWLRYVRAGDELYYLKNAIDSPTKLQRFNFYLVHINYFCKPSMKKYIPAEISLVEFNLAEGIKNTYHTLINPGPIPLGYALEAKTLSQEGHGLPVPPHCKGEKDKTKVAEAVKRFLKFGTGPTGKYPPLFTLAENALPTMHMLNDLVPYNEDQPVFTVYPIHRMFSWLKSQCSEACNRGGESPLDESFALKEIERDCFRYLVEIACDFHKKSETHFPMCSLSITKRLAFIICDHCCRDLNITLVGGKHTLATATAANPENETQQEENCNGGAEGQEEEQEQEQEPQPENRGETEEEVPLERSLAMNCNCGEVPEFVGGYSTREIPTDNLERLNPEEFQQFYNAFMHNMMEGKVKIEDEGEDEKDRAFLRATEGGDLADNPFAAPQTSRPDGSLPTAAEEVEAFRQQEIRKMRNMAMARIKAREAHESCRAYKKKNKGATSTRADGEGTSTAQEPDQ